MDAIYPPLQTSVIENCTRLILPAIGFSCMLQYQRQMKGMWDGDGPNSTPPGHYYPLVNIHGKTKPIWEAL